MSPPKQSKQGIIKGLHAHTQAIGRSVSHDRQPFSSHIVGICLYGHFRVTVNGVKGKHLLQDGGQHLWRQLTGSSATYIYRMYAREGKFVFPLPDFL